MSHPPLQDTRYFGYFEKPFTVTVPGFPHPHEVRIWLPPSYHHSDREFPTLWVTDNLLEVAQSALLGSMLGVAPELILVSIGGPLDSSFGEFTARRLWDFLPAAEWFRPGFLDVLGVMPAGAADRFRDYLIDTLRPQLQQQYRMSADGHGLFGHSGGCVLATYSLFTRPDAFSRYLCSSGFGLDHTKLAAALSHRDLGASTRVYFSVGGAEGPGLEAGMREAAAAAVGLGIPSTAIDAVVHAGLDHFTIVPAMMSAGVRRLWPECLSGPDWFSRMQAVRHGDE